MPRTYQFFCQNSSRCHRLFRHGAPARPVWASKVTRFARPPPARLLLPDCIIRARVYVRRHVTHSPRLGGSPCSAMHDQPQGPTRTRLPAPRVTSAHLSKGLYPTTRHNRSTISTISTISNDDANTSQPNCDVFSDYSNCWPHTQRAAWYIGRATSHRRCRRRRRCRRWRCRRRARRGPRRGPRRCCGRCGRCRAAVLPCCRTATAAATAAAVHCGRALLRAPRQHRTRARK